MKLHPFDMRRRLIASAYRSKKYDKVKKLSERYLLKYPNDVMILELLARSHVSSQEWGSAYPLYSRLFNLEPEYRDVCDQYARCSIYEKKWGQINSIIEVSPNVLLTSQIQRALVKKLTSISDEEFLEFTELSGPCIDSIPIDALHRWANMDRDLREHVITQYDEICLRKKVGGTYLGIVLGNIISKSESEARKLIKDFVEMYGSLQVERWIKVEYNLSQELAKTVVNWLLEFTPEEKINQLYDQFAEYIPMQEFINLEHLSTISSSIEIAHIWLVETMMLQQRSDDLVLLIERNLPGTTHAIEQTFQRNISGHRRKDTLWLLSVLHGFPEIFMIQSIRRVIAKALHSAGAIELAYEFSIKSIELNPQDGVSAFVALQAAIEMVDDDRILEAADINLNLRAPDSRINYASIISSCFRKQKITLAIDAMERFRLKMDDAGHRLRIGYPFHILKDWSATIDAIEITPEKYRDLPQIKLIEASAYAKLGDADRAIEACNGITDSVELLCARYSTHFLNGNYKSAFDELDSHFLNVYGAGLSKTWVNKKLSYFKLKTKKTQKVTGPLVSVIMTIHQWNDAFPLAINSILNQSYTDIELLLIDDESSAEDVERYQPYLNDSRIKYHRVSVNQGTYPCRNHGVNLAKGEYITFADSDDWNHPCRIEFAVKDLEENGAHMTHGRYIRMKADGSMNIDGGRPARFALMAMFWRSKILKKVFGGFDGRARTAADSELYERARTYYGSKLIMRNNRVEIIALSHGSSLTGGGSMIIDWLGPGPDRLRYVSGYHHWHQEIKKLGVPPMMVDNPPFAAPHDSKSKNDSIVKELESLFRFNSTTRNIDISSIDVSDLSESTEISIGMATYPGGYSTLLQTVESLCHQTIPFTRLQIHVNGNEPIPVLPLDSRIKVVYSDIDLTDIGKFKAVDGYEGYILTVDDDLYYPPDYVENMLGVIENNNRNCFIGVHGALLPVGPAITRWSDYKSLRRTHNFETHLFSELPVNVIGTGTLAYHTDIGVIPWSRFDTNRMVDLHLAVHAQKNKIPMKLISRERMWLREINQELEERIWQTANSDKNLQWGMIDVLQRCDNWQLLSNQGDQLSTFLPSSLGNISWLSRELPPGMILPELTTDFDLLSNPLVTIYIPMFNAENYIEETIQSALSQTYTNIEICIHDDGSTDSSLVIVTELFGQNPKVKISSSENSGIGAASNRAINLGMGELIFQLDSDDIIEPNAVENLVLQFNKNPEIVCSYGNFCRIDLEGKTIDQGWEHPVYCRNRLMRSMIVHPPRLFRRDAFVNIGGFNEKLTNAVDYDFYSRLSLLGPMIHLREILYSYRIHSESTSQAKTVQQDKNTSLVHRMMLDKYEQSAKFTPYAANINFPRRIIYVHNWSMEPAKNVTDSFESVEEINELPFDETNAIEISNVDLYFPKSKSLLRGLINLLKSNDSFTKNHFKALDKINLQVKQGEVLGVIGRNGSGKSTMVRTMAGIYRPDNGTVRTRGRTTLLAGVSVGLNQNLTGVENVHLYGSILGHNRETMDGMMDEIIQFSELEEFIEQPLRTYSSGMKARLGLAIASAIEPEILLIDEVLGVGDQQFKEKSKKRILDLVKSTGTVVIVSHSFGLMTEICDRIVLIHNGQVADIGDPQKVIGTYYKLTN
jgi:ABC-type polysaccharide/polyol phosphate transport system ATPase subunit/cellulose synthase/poly-beta-1,6-N-acetylglucosamine synthase-like glycosyltransferase